MKFSRKFSILTKQRIVEYYKSGLKSEKQIRQEYGLTAIQLSQLVRWYNQLVLSPKQDSHHSQKIRTMKNNKKTVGKTNREKKLEQQLKKLEQKHKQLEKDFKDEQLKNKIYVKIVDIVERDLNIPVRKKYGTKQSEK